MLQLNVRKIYADLNAAPVNSYDFFMPRRQFPVSWDIFCVSSTVLQQVLKLCWFNRISGKIFIPWKLSEWIVTIFFWLQRISVALKKFLILYYVAEDTEIILQQFQLHKIYGDSTKAPINDYDFFLPQWRDSIKWNIVFPYSIISTKILELFFCNRMFGKFMGNHKSSEWTVTISLWLSNSSLSVGIFFVLLPQYHRRYWSYFASIESAENFSYRENSEWIVTIFLDCRSFLAALNKISLFYIKLYMILEWFCNNFRFTKFVGIQRRSKNGSNLRLYYTYIPS